MGLIRDIRLLFRSEDNRKNYNLVKCSYSILISPETTEDLPSLIKRYATLISFYLMALLTLQVDIELLQSLRQVRTSITQPHNLAKIDRTSPLRFYIPSMKKEQKKERHPTFQDRKAIDKEELLTTTNSMTAKNEMATKLAEKEEEMRVIKQDGRAFQRNVGDTLLDFLDQNMEPNDIITTLLSRTRTSKKNPIYSLRRISR